MTQTTPAPAFDQELDARGLTCPQPLLRTKKKLFEMRSGQVLRVLATDPGAASDFSAFSQKTGNTLILSSALDDGAIAFYLRRA